MTGPSKRKAFIYAKLDVCIWGHDKFVAAGPAAVGLWAAALAYLRWDESSDAYIKPHVLGLLLGLGEREARKLAERLADVGLFARQDRGYVLLGYVAKNETKEEISARRAATRDRVAEYRATRGGHGNADGSTPCTLVQDEYGGGTGVARTPLVPVSVSHLSESSLGSSPEGSRGLGVGPPPEQPVLVPLGDPSPPRDELAEVFAEWVERRAVRTYGTLAAAAARNRSTDPRFSAERRKLLVRWTRAGYTAEALRLAVRGLVADNTLVNGRTPKWQDVRSFSWMLESQDQLDAYVESGAASAERERERRAKSNGSVPHEPGSGVVAVAPVAAEEPKAAGGAA